MNKDNKYFETKSFALSATLISLGIPLDNVVKDFHGKATFSFLRTDGDFDEILSKFWKKELRIEPISFFENQRFLKSRIYGG